MLTRLLTRAQFRNSTRFMSSTSFRSALMIIDMQNDFCPPHGSLKVDGATDALPVINRLRSECKFDLITLSQDWHPSNHMSFFENNKNKAGAQLFSVLNLPDVGPQVMWPVHCVQHSTGAEFHPQLKMESTDVIVQKGTNTNVDSYSAFHDNNATSQTEMNQVLKRKGITHIFFTGVATDFCVGYSVLDAKNEGFDCTLILDACRGVAPESTQEMLKKLKDLGVAIVDSSAVLNDPRLKKGASTERLSHNCVVL